MRSHVSELQREGYLNAILLVSALCLGGSQLCAQAPGAVQLRIDIEKTVNYYQDITDYSKLAVDPARKASLRP